MRDDFTSNHKNDLAWLITLRGVKVRHSLRNWGYISSPRCASCSRIEMIDHCFLNCPRAKSVWLHSTPLLSAFCYHAPLCLTALPFSFTSFPVTSLRIFICSYLLSRQFYMEFGNSEIRLPFIMRKKTRRLLYDILIRILRKEYSQTNTGLAHLFFVTSGLTLLYALFGTMTI